MTAAFSYYLKSLTSLKCASTRYGPAPHKPALLITFLEMAQRGMLPENRVRVNADLVGFFQENWRLLVTTPHQDFTQPFYYLQNDKVQGKAFRNRPARCVKSYSPYVVTGIKIFLRWERGNGN